ncbi:hypothetical protein LTR17_021768 [Elasticomyces elasticus]|nr:hypothetical protein LTR17_021768 [Elasticomyces elasticus]
MAAVMTVSAAHKVEAEPHHPVRSGHYLLSTPLFALISGDLVASNNSTDNNRLSSVTANRSLELD